MNTQQKYILLRNILLDLRKVVVAYSGGVDSTFLLKVAVDTLGSQNVLAVIADTPSLPRSQYKFAVNNAKKLKAKLLTIKTNELDLPQYSRNAPDRCFHCKSNLFAALTKIAKQKHFNTVLSGANFDDLADYRPGHKAAKIFDIKSPLIEAKLTKKNIRQLSRTLNLSTASLPASPCLASRIAYNLNITRERLNQVEKAEEFLKSLGLVEFRVRHHDLLARIETHRPDFKLIMKEPNRRRIIKKFKSLGFKYVTLDLQPFRSGSMNEALSNEQKQKSIV